MWLISIFCLEVDFVWLLLALSLNITWNIAYEYTWINRIKVICRPCLLISSEFTSMLMTDTCTWHHKAQAIEMILPFMNDRKFFQWRIWYRPLWFWLCALLCWCSLNTMNWNSTDMVHFVRSGLPALDIENGHRTILKGLFMSILCVDFSKWQDILSVAIGGQCTL